MTGKQLPFEFVIDKDNERIFDLLCMYFSGDERFNEQKIKYSDGKEVQEAAKLLWDESDQLNKGENGRTPSGLYRFLMTADRAKNFDKYGYPNVALTITPFAIFALLVTI